MENKYWKKCVGTLIGAIWLYTLAGIAGSITEAVNGMLNPGGVMGMMASFMGGDGGGSAFGIGDLLEYLFPLLVLLGYYLFYSSLSQLMRLQQSTGDREAVAKVRKAYILMVVAIIVEMIPVLGTLAALVVMIVAYVKMLSGYKLLKLSATFPEEARRGAGLLFTATVWLLVSYIIGCIPLVGGAIESVISFILFFCVLAGWRRIQRGAPELTEAEAEVLKTEETATTWPREKQNKVLGYWLLAFAGLSVISMLVYGAFAYGWIPDRMQTVPLPSGYRTFMLYSSVFRDFMSACYLGLYLWFLLNRNLKFRTVSVIGLGLLVLNIIVGFVRSAITYGFIEMEASSNLANMIPYLVSEGCFLVGMLLFIWGALSDLFVRITVTAGTLIGELLSMLCSVVLFRHYLPAVMPTDQEQVFQVHAMVVEMADQILSLILLGFYLLYFLLLLWAVTRWWKKTIPAADAVAE